MRTLDELVHRNEQLIELDTLQPPPEAVLRHALRAALGDCAVSSSLWTDQTEASRAEQREKEADWLRDTGKDVFATAETEQSGERDWSASTNDEQKYETF